MAKQLGRKLLIALSNEANNPVYTTLAGGQNVTVTDTVASIDATTPNSTTRGNPPPHEAFAGKRMISFSGTFTLMDDTAEGTLDTIAKSTDRANDMRLTIPGFKTYTGKVLMTEIRYEGSIDGMVQYSLAGEMTGTITEASL